MRIAHGYAGHAVLVSKQKDRFVYHLFCACRYLFRRKLHHVYYFRRFHNFWLRHKFRRPHIDLYKNNFFILNGKLQLFYLSRADNTDFLFGGKPPVVHIFSHAADAVAAHFRAASVRIIHLHLKICFPGWIDKDNTVSSNPKMPVAKPFCQRRLIFLRYFFHAAVHVDVVIAASMHFYKFHICIVLCLFTITI